MARRVKLPSADDLFRPTAPDPAPLAAETPDTADTAAADTADTATSGTPGGGGSPAAERTTLEEQAPRRPSGRVKHDEKMTVYITSAELLDLEQARLRLRADHGLAIDRGRLVRQAIALALVDLETNGAQSAIVRRLADG